MDVEEVGDSAQKKIAQDFAVANSLISVEQGASAVMPLNGSTLAQGEVSGVQAPSVVVEVPAEVPIVVEVPSRKCIFRVFKDGETRRCGVYALKGLTHCAHHLTSTEREALALASAYKTVTRRKHHKVRKAYSLDAEMAEAKNLVEILAQALDQSIEEAGGKEHLNSMGKALASSVRQLSGALDTCSRVAERMHKMEEGERIRLDVNGINTLVNNVQVVIQKYIKDVGVLQNIADDLAALSQG